MKVLMNLYLYIWMTSTRLICDCRSMLPTHTPHDLGVCSMYFVLSCDGFPQYSITNGCVEQTSLWMYLLPGHIYVMNTGHEVNLTAILDLHVSLALSVTSINERSDWF